MESLVGHCTQPSSICHFDEAECQAGVTKRNFCCLICNGPWHMILQIGCLVVVRILFLVLQKLPPNMPC